MRKFALALVIVAAASACNIFRRGGDPPAHREPKTTSIYGDWILASPIDSTAFAGADRVEMSLEQSTFRIIAFYPSGTPTEFAGSVSVDNHGIVTLTPSTGSTQSAYARRALALAPGQPISLLASAAGGSLVFKPPQDDIPIPSSVWNRRAQAQQAGKIPNDSSVKDSI